VTGGTFTWFFPLAATLIAIGLFFNGRRFARVEENPLSGRTLLGLPVRGSELSVVQMRRLGRIQMYAAPMFWVFFMIISFVGP
jgi:hypothetical protein